MSRCSVDKTPKLPGSSQWGGFSIPEPRGA